MINIFQTILEMLWFFLPAYVANMMATGSKYLRILDKPVDFGKSWKGVRILGDHKTFRGFIVGIIFSILLAFLQTRLVSINFFNSISLLDYSTVNFVFLGFLLGFGALFGDSIESFFKRRIGLEPGKPWIPFDQIDWVLGGLVFGAIIYALSFWHIVAAVILFPVLHVVINYISYYLKIKNEKW